MNTKTKTKKTLQIVVAALLPCAAGCGTNLNEALLLAAESGARTFLDIMVSDFYSDLPTLFSIPAGPGDTTGGGGDTGDGGGDTGGDGAGGDGSGLTGDAVNGAALFSANTCFACHCEDGSGGCALSAPNIQGEDFATIKERLQGETAHPGGKFPDLTDQDIADIEAFLAA